MRLSTKRTLADGDRDVAYREAVRPAPITFLHPDGRYSFTIVKKVAGGGEVQHYKSQIDNSGVLVCDANALDSTSERSVYVYKIDEVLSPTSGKKGAIIVSGCLGYSGTPHTSLMEALSQEIISMAKENGLGILVLNDMQLRYEVEKGITLLRKGEK